jgi:hypothetical protein
MSLMMMSQCHPAQGAAPQWCCVKVRHGCFSKGRDIHAVFGPVRALQTASGKSSAVDR